MSPLSNIITGVGIGQFVIPNIALPAIQQHEVSGSEKPSTQFDGVGTMLEKGIGSIIPYGPGENSYVKSPLDALTKVLQVSGIELFFGLLILMLLYVVVSGENPTQIVKHIRGK